MISDKYTSFFHNDKKIFKIKKKLRSIGLKKSPDPLILVFFLVGTQS